MQRIDRYGLVTLVFLLVTFVAVVVWGEGHGDLFQETFRKKTLLAKADESALSNSAKNGRVGLSNEQRGTLAGSENGRARKDLAKAELNAGPASFGAQGTKKQQNAERNRKRGNNSKGAAQARKERNNARRKSGEDQLGARRSTQTKDLDLSNTAVAKNRAPAAEEAARSGHQERAHSLIARPDEKKHKPRSAFTAQVESKRGQAQDESKTKTRLTSQPGKQPTMSSGSSGSSRSPKRGYTVQSGDTLGHIAFRELGSSKRWREIVDANPGIDPNRLYVGKQLNLPGEGAVAREAVAQKAKSEPADKVRTKPAAASKKAGYQVQSGDTLGQIAQRELGSSNRWREIVEMNPGLDPRRLAVGAQLRMPGVKNQSGTRRSSQGAAASNGSRLASNKPSKPKAKTGMVAQADRTQRSWSSSRSGSSKVQ